jgi:hypothetical protein
MPLIDDQTIPVDAILFRVLLPDPNWTTNKGGRLRPASLAFYSAEQEVSYFLESPGMLTELQRIFPGHKIARVPAAVMRGQGFAIERRPDPADCPADFGCDRACHVVAGPNAELPRPEFQRRARNIATHQDVTIIKPEAQPPGANPQP